MTLVAGVHSNRFAILSADSRITTVWGTGVETRVDCCQKVFRVGDESVIGFCGDLVAISEVLTTVSLLHQHDAKLVRFESLFAKLPRGLKAGMTDLSTRMGRAIQLGVIVAGRLAGGDCGMFACASPDYVPQLFSHHEYALMGSGEPILRPVARHYGVAIAGTMAYAGAQTPDIVAGRIGQVVDSHLERSGVRAVGRVLHHLCLDDGGVSRLNYRIARGKVDFEEGSIVAVKVASFIGTCDEGANWI